MTGDEWLERIAEQRAEDHLNRDPEELDPWGRTPDWHYPRDMWLARP